MKRARTLATGALAISAVLLAGCAGIPPTQMEAPTIYVLDARPAERSARPQRDLVLVVSVPRARAGFDTAQMAFVREPHELEYFAKSRWADTPSRMLAPLLVQALEQAGGFRAVVQAPNAVPADLRLDTELVRLQQNFATRPSQVELALRAQLVDVRSRRVLATAEFEEVEPATREGAYGGVIAANRALQRILVRLAEFCAEQSGSR
jgi:cholesterol transport system auxiliary component